jgi:aminomethyltransferase
VATKLLPPVNSLASCTLSSRNATTFELPSLVAGSRFRKSCFFESTVLAGVTGFTTYNKMLLPTSYSTSTQEYANLKRNVNLWDVAVQRQIEFSGPDAAALADYVTPRPLKDMKVGDARYAVITDNDGMILNDPVVLRLAEDRFWLSIADSEVLLWFKGLALAKNFNVRIVEAKVSPLAVQGPRSLDLMCELFGDWVRDLKFYKFVETTLNGMPIVVVRAGWSPERGYELFLQDESRGNELWQRVHEAGEKHSILPGVPQQARRIEGGLLSYGADITPEHHVLEMGLPQKWFKFDKEGGFCGQDSVERLLAEGGPKRRVMGVKVLDDKPVPSALIRPWAVTNTAGCTIGKVTSFAFSPQLEAHIGVATVSADAAEPSTLVNIQTPDGDRTAAVHSLPFLPRVH